MRKIAVAALMFVALSAPAFADWATAPGPTPVTSSFLAASAGELLSSNTENTGNIDRWYSVWRLRGTVYRCTDTYTRTQTGPSTWIGTWREETCVVARAPR